MNYQNITKTDFVNGKGVRVVLWTSGCTLACKNCHNPESWDESSGKPFDIEAKKELFEAIGKSYIKGLTLSGGHPLEEYNLEDVYNLLKEVKSTFPNKDIWLYTGLSWENIIYTKESTNYSELRKSIVSLCDVLVDGRYMDELRDISLPWRGSSNQRVIDVQKSLQENRVISWIG